MASIKITLRNKASKEGLYPIILRIVKDRKSKLISLGLECLKKDWDVEKNEFKKSHPNYLQRNRIILKYKEKALKIIDDFSLENVDFTLIQFENKFRGIQEKPLLTNVVHFFNEIISELELSGRIGNAKAYKETKEAIIKFAGKEILFEHITPEFLEKFEVYLRSRENNDGGIAFKMRELRALFNTSIRRKIINRELYPFGEYKISKLKTKKNKKALSVEDFKKFRDVNLSNHPCLIEAYNYSMFSFYTRGMNFIDMMFLKWSDIQDGRIYYTRSKTKGQFNIEVTEKVQEILDYYKSQNRPTQYVFPIILKEDLTLKQIAARKHKVLSRYNKKLKKISKIAGIEKDISSYTFRHSFATILKQIGTSTDVISELMGHTDVQITMTYLKEFDKEILDNENRKLLEI